MCCHVGRSAVGASTTRCRQRHTGLPHDHKFTHSQKHRHTVTPTWLRCRQSTLKGSFMSVCVSPAILYRSSDGNSEVLDAVAKVQSL